ncbi:MAG: ATP-binding cassette domain-containing protein [Clostridia bacterium]|nr:ATP-binding cassette domain-containing protein [Clostridia bacterium]MBQ4349770.1 ATP-binding cassette domain-containing protein [Clostridia bacterium]
MSKLELKSVSFKYPRGKRMIFQNVSESFESGRLTTVEGESGAGKSTLLTLLSGLALPTKGELLMDGEPIRDLTDYRRNIAATIAQANHLFEGRTVLENVTYPMLLKGTDPQTARQKALAYLADVKLDEELATHYPSECSGGEQKRVAFARAMALDNPVILADEPTANLDKGTSRVIADILESLAHERGRLVIAVTHDDLLPERADVRLYLRGGVLEHE